MQAALLSFASLIFLVFVFLLIFLTQRISRGERAYEQAQQHLFARVKRLERGMRALSHRLDVRARDAAAQDEQSRAEEARLREGIANLLEYGATPCRGARENEAAS